MGLAISSLRPLAGSGQDAAACTVPRAVVRGTRRFAVALTASLLGAAAWADGLPEPAQPARLLRASGQVVQLAESKGACELRVQSPGGTTQAHATRVPWPCAFHTDAQGRIRTALRGNEVIALVEWSRLQDARTCDSRIQAVVVGPGDRARVADHMERVAECPPAQWPLALFNPN